MIDATSNGKYATTGATQTSCTQPHSKAFLTFGHPEIIIHDKKNEYGAVQFVLLHGIGKTIINQEVENELIKKAFEDYKS